MQNLNDSSLLQLFAEEGATGVTASDAGMPSGEEAAPAAGVQDREAEFEALIQGEFKEQYDTRVQDTIRKRLRGSKQTLEKYEALTPALQLLAQHYGIEDPQDVEALNNAISQDDTLRPGKPDAPAPSEVERIALRCQQWHTQEQEARKLYPSLDLVTEMKNPRFVGALRSGADVATAYELTHRDEILSGAMQYAAQVTRQKLADRLAARSSRPMENGMNGQGAALTRYDVTQMTRQDRDAIRRRVAGGEKIRF